MSDVSGRSFVGAQRLSRHRRRSISGVGSRQVADRLAALETAMTALMQAQANDRALLDGLVDRLDKQVVRAGRELFKANTLAEVQHKSVETAFEELRQNEGHRERELAQLRERLGEAHDEGRVDLIQRLLPALDGLQDALDSGRRLVQQAATKSAAPSIWERIIPAIRASRAAESSSVEAMAAWLAGVAFVNERLLEVLAVVDVVPIVTEGRSFDPHRHVAVETVPADAAHRPGAIVRERRSGYIRGETVLRFAEVVVARDGMEIS